MSEKGPFDAAINYLQEMADKDFANGAPHRGEFRDAIRVLEAARKVSPNAMKFVDGWFIRWFIHAQEWSESFSSTDIEMREKIRALLEALPDKEKK
jgi:hypothetical protein